MGLRNSPVNLTGIHKESIVANSIFNKNSGPDYSPRLYPNARDYDWRGEPDPILRLEPVWAFDAQASVLEIEHLAKVPSAKDLIEGNDAVQANATYQPLWDQTAQGGRGGLYGVTQSVQKWLGALISLDSMTEWTIITSHSLRDWGRYSGTFSIRENPGISAGYNTTTGYIQYTDNTFIRNSGDHDTPANTMVSYRDSEVGVNRTRQDSIVRVAAGLVDHHVNGKLVDSVATTWDPMANPNGLMPVLGRGYYTGYLNGWLHQVYVFNRALSDEDRDIVIAEMDRRWPNYYRDALPQAWSHFSFNEAQGLTTAVDSAGGIPAGGALGNGTATRSPMDSEASPTGFSFDGANDYIELPLASLDYVTDSAVFSIEAFCTITNTTSASEVVAGNWVNTTDSFMLDIAGNATPKGSIRFYSGSAVAATNQVIALNESAPQHVVCTGDGTTVRIYVDGSEVASGAFTPKARASSRLGYIGGLNTGARVLGGKMNEVNFHTVTLTPAEIEARTRLYRGDLGQRLIDGLGVGATGLKHLFMMEELRGSTTFTDRISLATGGHENGVAAGVYSDIRGTTRRASYDGANDKSYFLDADFDIDMTGSWTWFGIIKMPSTIVSGKNLFSKYSSNASFGSMWCSTNGTAGATRMMTRTPGGSVTQLHSAVNIPAGTTALIALISDPVGGNVHYVVIPELTTLSRVTSARADFDFENTNRWEIGGLFGLGTWMELEASSIGLVQRALTDVELQWIADIAKWS